MLPKQIEVIGCRPTPGLHSGRPAIAPHLAPEKHAIRAKAIIDMVSKRPSRDLILWFFLIVFAVSCLLLGWLLQPFFSIIVLALVVTGVFNPLYRRLCTRLPATAASLLTCVVIFFVLFVPISFFVGVLANEAYELYLAAKGFVLGQFVRDLIENSPLIDRVNQLLAHVNMTITGEELNRGISELGRVVGLYLYDQARAITTNVFSFIVNFFFMLLIVFYLFVDGHRLVSFITNLSPLPDDQDRKLINKFKDIARAVLLGNGLGGLIQGTLGGIVFAVFGLKSPFLWGVIMALLAFLPIVGIGAVFIPAAVYLFVKDRVAAGIFFVVFYLVVSGGIEYFFKPRLVGQRMQMHTLLIFFSIIGGLKLFGILGIIYGPLVVTAFLTLADIYQSSYRNLVEPIT
jgi:predicted PurR-regulated permease PerM